MYLKGFSQLGTCAFWYLAGLYASGRYRSQPWGARFFRGSLSSLYSSLLWRACHGGSASADDPVVTFRKRSRSHMVDYRVAAVLWCAVECDFFLPLRFKFRACLQVFSPATFCAWFLLKRCLTLPPGALWCWCTPQGENWLPSFAGTSWVAAWCSGGWPSC